MTLPNKEKMNGAIVQREIYASSQCNETKRATEFFCNSYDCKRSNRWICDGIVEGTILHAIVAGETPIQNNENMHRGYVFTTGEHFHKECPHRSIAPPS